MSTGVKDNLSGARNIGPAILKRLNEIGVHTLSDLAEMTSVQAYRNICVHHPGKTIPVCYYLYALEGALVDLHWNDLPPALKRELRIQAEK